MRLYKWDPADFMSAPTEASPCSIKLRQSKTQGGRFGQLPAARFRLSPCSSGPDCRLFHAYGQGRRVYKQSLVHAVRRKVIKRVVHWNPVSQLNENSPGGNRIPTRSQRSLVSTCM